MLDTERLCLGCMNDNGGEKVCSICGYEAKNNNDPEFLPVKFWLKERYYIGAAHESNGEGVTYIGWDNKDDQIVEIREYFPKGAAVRNSDKSVGIESGNEFAFNDGIMNFLELNRKLMGLEGLPALLPTVEVFEDNGTAYSVTKSVPSIPLREFLIRNGGNLTWEQARPLFLPVITTLTELHEAGIIHRGISPETISVGRDGKLRINSICIRSVRMSKSNMTIQLFPGYSAIEQYGYDLENRDGKYTDVYGIAATLFRVLMGKAPTDVTERISNDNMQIPARFAEKIPKYVLAALANALQIMPENRTPNMDEFRISLTPVSADADFSPSKGEAPDKGNTAPVIAISDVKAKGPGSRKNKNGSSKTIIVAAGITAAIFIVLALAIYFIIVKPSGEEKENTSSADVSSEQVVSENKPNIIEPENKDKLYQVPDLVGKKYADVLNNNEYTLVFEITNEVTEYNDDYDRGYIIDQEPKKDQNVKKGTEIKVKISADSQKGAVPSLAGKTQGDAIFELLKEGFLYDNITVLNVNNANKPTGVVIETEPVERTKISRSAGIVLRVNAYEPEPEPVSQISPESTAESAVTE
ncbi:MAG: PASTA domain-containing protein [Clostridiales bacterium]|nr:PASTA domain-containing protein [Candidatus Equinaster intestinalis]